ncbi:cytochrome c3 family protein [Calderihabitans maritimus]|uniref:Putative cytochrome c-type protein n=1 Tax=Calderihabitans maritimus TaxID=1246530 RepID=A0A1Z5HUA4_9FIRM|nr:NapC/NirT family cytochrome c [Calderihabitans maritimus]GAW92988.1 putative cytochrome c-type protein [Calderihabitans maritimus]
MNFRIFIIFVLAITALIVLGIEYTSRPEFCSSCHEMKEFYTSWTTSSHRNVNCLKCHSDPGLVGLIKTKIKALGEVYHHFTQTYETPIKINSETWSFSRRCLRCHQEVVDKSNGPHNQKHFAMEMACTRCHEGLVHNPQTNTRLPSRQICRSCHGEAFK